MTLTQRMDMAWRLWRTTGQARYLEEYCALSDLAVLVRTRATHYLRALEEGLAIVRSEEPEPPITIPQSTTTEDPMESPRKRARP